MKSRQVERVLTKFKGCEPSCRKVQKVAALVCSGGVTGDHIYIFWHGAHRSVRTLRHFADEFRSLPLLHYFTTQSAPMVVPMSVHVI